MVDSATGTKMQLGEILVQKGLISESQLEIALQEQKKSKERLGKVLVQLGFLNGMQLVSALSTQNGVEFIKVNDCLIDPSILSEVTQATAEQFGCIPLIHVDDVMFVGVKNTPQLAINLEKLSKVTKTAVEPILIPDSESVERIIAEAYSTLTSRRSRDKKIGSYLVEKAILSDDQLKAALDRQRRTGQRLGEVLISQGYLSHSLFYESLSKLLGIPYVSMEQIRIAMNDEVARIVPREFAEYNLILPIGKEDGRIQVLTPGPLDMWLEEYLRGAAKVRVCEPFLASNHDIRIAIHEAFDENRKKGEIDLDVEVQDIVEVEEIDFAPYTDTFVPKIVNFLLYNAVRMGVSDIHIEQNNKRVNTRYRLDGELRPASDIPINKENVLRVISKIKLDCQLDISERRRPQDGSFRKRFDDKEVDFRVAIQPTVNGENCVIRILDGSKALPTLDEIGFQDEVLEKYIQMIHNPQGMVLFTGPTGSGKTTSLYATLDHMRQGNHKIITAENPVEYQFEGIQQCQTNDAIGNTFARFLRGFLRQDPDVILVGEMRDEETVRTGISAAMTGHLLFSTLHTNDTIGTVSRLLNMNIDPELLSSSLLCVISQRLVKTVCPMCKQAVEPTEQQKKDFYPAGLPKDVEFSTGAGCAACEYSGYKGRAPIFEFWEVDEPAQMLIQKGADEMEIRQAAYESGMVSMVQDALRKVESGRTDLEALTKVVPYVQIQRHRKRLMG